MTRSSQNGRALSMPCGIFVGVLYALGVIVLGITITAYLIHKEIIAENHMGYPIMVTLILSAYIGSQISYTKIKRKKTAVCFTSAVVLYITLLSVTVLFFGGQYSGVGETGILILCGSTLSVILKTHMSYGRQIRKSKIYRR